MIFYCLICFGCSSGESTFLPIISGHGLVTIDLGLEPRNEASQRLIDQALRLLSLDRISVKAAPADLTGVSIIVWLTVNTKYYVRAYAATRLGVAYGNEITFNSG